MSKDIPLATQLSYNAQQAISAVVEQLDNDEAHRVIAELRSHLEHRAHQTRPDNEDLI